MKLTLINPPQIFTPAQVAAGITPPLGLAYLAAYALRRGHSVSVIDAVGSAPDRVVPFRKEAWLRGLTLSQIADRVDPDAGLIGISNLFTFAYPAVEALCRVLKERRPDVPILLGGAHPSARYEEVLKNGDVDFVLVGEAEETIVELLEALSGRRSLAGVRSLAWRRPEPGGGSRVALNPEAARMKDLDFGKVPFPARHLLPMETYIKAQEAHGPVSARWTSIVSSRGCPYGCTFCASRRTRWVARAAADVVDEMEECLERWGITEFHFEDDNMTLDKGRTVALCREIIRRGLQIRWQTPNGIRASVTDGEMLAVMRESGCSHITVAPESGSPRVLNDIIQKGRDFRLEQLRDVSARAHALGLKVAAYFILGIPGERVEDVRLTMDYADSLARVGVDEVAFSLFIPLPGTPLWDACKPAMKGLDYLDLLAIGDLSRARSWSEHISDAELHALRREAYLRFHLKRLRYHPRRFLRTLLNVAIGEQQTKTERTLRQMLKRLKPLPPTRAEERGDLDSYPFDARRTLKLLLKSEGRYAYQDSLLKTGRLIAGDFWRALTGRL